MQYLNSINRLAIVGNALPRRCGIATFTTDLQHALSGCSGVTEAAVVAMTDHGRTYAYPSFVRLEINDTVVTDYTRAADFLNESEFQVVSLQHEYGIFGGDAGRHLLTLLASLQVPLVTTLHTLLTEPSRSQREVLNAVVNASSHLIVMSRMGQEILRSVHGVEPRNISIVPHGIPSAAFVEPDAAKLKLGFCNKSVILTFGLLSPNKGIEVMIDAMPAILTRRPDSIYVVLGATHPNLLRQAGESYRDSLIARAQSLGVSQQVVFLNQFVDQATLIDFITMCDVYVTPYLNEAQMTSGTLSYSFGLGKAVVSTPYWHARELLADGRGILVPFNDSKTIGSAIAELLTNDALRLDMRERAYENSRSMTWERTATRHLEIFEKARQPRSFGNVRPPRESIARFVVADAPQIQLHHFLSMCDDTGLFQHAVHSVPNRSHGYCVDDNARALLVGCALNRLGEIRLPEAVTGRFAAFVQHAWNPDARRFRNFMHFDRRWLEDAGSEDCHGRALWALGECSRSDADPSRRRWASSLFLEALPAVGDFSSPRAWSFTMLGLNAYCDTSPDDDAAFALWRKLADRLMTLLSSVETVDWVWFETGLAYDNARLPQALITAGSVLADRNYIDAGLRTLRWLMNVQTSKSGVFRPVGSDSFGEHWTAPRRFDQQPLEATAAISACIAAWHAVGDSRWKADASRALAWFLGRNDLNTPLVDLETGSCRDGLHSDRPNQNQGGESVVSYLLALAESRSLARMSDTLPASAPLPAACA